MADSKPRPFRVIVVGAGVNGLLVSHIFQKSNVDHVVLEKRASVAPPEGASIGIYPHGARILQQVGVLETLSKACAAPGRWIMKRPDGKTILDSRFFQLLQVRHGTGMFLLERRKYLQILYDTLPSQDPIKLGCAVREIRHTPTGVEVVLQDGSVETGDMVMGCDGAYSSVRTMMWEYAGQTSPQLITAQEKRSMKTSFKALIGVTPRPPGTAKNNLITNHGHKRAFLGLLTPETMFYAFFFRLEQPIVSPRRATYTAQDAEVLAESVADYPISDTLLFDDIWKNRTRGALVPLEEGLLEHWYYGRIALVGDATLKITPNMGLGGNSGMESVAVLCSQIHRMLADTRPGERPDQEALTAAFAAYQAERRTRAAQVLALSGLILRMQSSENAFFGFLGNTVLPMMPDALVVYLFGVYLRRAPKLDFLDASGFPKGSKLWRDEEPISRGIRALLSSMLPVLVVSGGLATIWWQVAQRVTT